MNIYIRNERNAMQSTVTAAGVKHSEQKANAVDIETHWQIDSERKRRKSPNVKHIEAKKGHLPI